MLCCSISCLSGSISPILFLSNFISKTERERGRPQTFPGKKRWKLYQLRGKREGDLRVLPTRVLGLVAIATFFYIFFLLQSHTFIITFVQYTHPSSFAEASLHFLIALVLSGEKPPCGAEPRIELGPAFQQADALPTEPRRTIQYW